MVRQLLLVLLLLMALTLLFATAAEVGMMWSTLHAGNIGTAPSALWANSGDSNPWVRLAFDEPVSDSVTVYIWWVNQYHCCR